MKSVLSFACAATLVLLPAIEVEGHPIIRRFLSTTPKEQALEQQQHRGLLDHQAYFLQTLNATAMEAMDKCEIDLPSLSIFGEQYTSGTIDEITEVISFYASLFPKTCSDEEEQTFRKALDTFQTCSSFDLEGVLETFGDVIVGSVLECAMDFAPLLVNVNGFADIEFPAKCAETLLGQNPLGDIIRNLFLYPDKLLSCFPELSESIPSCTVDEWPVPLVGPVLKKSTCFVGQMKTFLKRLGEHNLDLLDTCLPELDYNDSPESPEEPAEIKCKNYCSHLGQTEVMLNFPFSDLVNDLAEELGLQDVIPRFEAFAAQCLPDPWQGWSYATNDYNMANVKVYPEHNPRDGSAMSSSTMTDNAEYDHQEEDRSLVIGLVAGFAVGLFTAGILWAIVQCCRKRRKNKTTRTSSFETNKEADDTGSSSGESDSEDAFEDVTHTIS